MVLLLVDFSIIKGNLCKFVSLLKKCFSHAKSFRLHNLSLVTSDLMLHLLLTFCQFQLAQEPWKIGNFSGRTTAIKAFELDILSQMETLTLVRAKFGIDDEAEDGLEAKK